MVKFRQWNESVGRDDKAHDSKVELSLSVAEINGCNEEGVNGNRCIDVTKNSEKRFSDNVDTLLLVIYIFTNVKNGEFVSES